MKRQIKKQRNQPRGIQQRILLAGVLFSLFAMLAAEAAAPNKQSSWMEEGGAVLMQHPDGLSALGLQAFTQNAAAAQWTNVPENAGEWKAVAMDGNRILFFYKAGSELAVCRLDENGAPVDWLSINRRIRRYTPVALEGNRILIQRGSRGKLGEIQFNDDGDIVSEKLLWKKSKGWSVRGMDANRIVLEHKDTGAVAVWAGNPKAPLFRPYKSFILQPGWSVRDFAGDFILIQQREAGAVKLVELGDDYTAKETTELVSVNEGWKAVALAQK